jgi:hypothetical protein
MDIIMSEKRIIIFAIQLTRITRIGIVINNIVDSTHIKNLRKEMEKAQFSIHGRN